MENEQEATSGPKTGTAGGSKATQFKPGQSGNPRGRKKGSKNKPDPFAKLPGIIKRMVEIGDENDEWLRKLRDDSPTAYMNALTMLERLREASKPVGSDSEPIAISFTTMTDDEHKGLVAAQAAAIEIAAEQSIDAPTGKVKPAAPAAKEPLTIADIKKWLAAYIPDLQLRAKIVGTIKAAKKAAIKIEQQIATDAKHDRELQEGRDRMITMDDDPDSDDFDLRAGGKDGVWRSIGSQDELHDELDRRFGR